MTRMKTAALAAAIVAMTGCGAGRMRMPSTAPADDNTTAVRVRTALANATGVHPSEIQVEVSSGVVVLKGQVHGDNEINAAIAAARQVGGVRDVKSELTPK